MTKLTKCQMIPTAGAYKVVTPYMSSFVSELKETVPASDRAYDRDSKCWTVSAQYGNAVGALIAKCFGQWIDLKPVTVKPAVGIIELLYLGKTKDRGNGQKTAFGWTQPTSALLGGWNVIFPEAVLRAWFDPSYTEQSAERPGTATYYETLGIKPTASLDEIKTGYRRMVKQWHPDVCKDPDAAEVFRTVQKAYELLSNPKTKARYDVGLKLEASAGAKTPKRKTDDTEYRAPLKCGKLLCEYTLLGMKMTVSRIFEWDDITDIYGQTLVSSWTMGDNEPTLEWR